MRTVIVFFLSITWAVTACAADVTAEKVDPWFAAFDKPGSPGCSVGVLRKGHFVYKKSFGYAGLEIGVPLTHNQFSTLAQRTRTSQSRV
ncbi:MAG TPA: hypothetical protein VFE61_24720 [Candidatus Sulfotelmatobacter sp.]|jgi:CubicO group peptidase (beta-lactamase class C family)|nr:hypothetical protein [Candidatus Sulfotelmatobacter sp.]